MSEINVRILQLQRDLASVESQQSTVIQQLQQLSTRGPGFAPASRGGRLREEQESLSENARHLRKQIHDLLHTDSAEGPQPE